MCKICEVAQELHELIKARSLAQCDHMASMDIGSIDTERTADFDARSANRKVEEKKKEMLHILQRY